MNAVALGTFDGLHKGHLSVLDIPEGYSKKAVIFNIPPKCEKMGVYELLLKPSEKVQRLEAMGFEVEALSFKEVESTSPEEFLEFIKEKLNPSLISCGFNYHFGFKGKGNTEDLSAFCKKNEINLKVAAPVTDGEEIISSSRIRNCIRQGNIEEANRLLGYDFSFCAPVLHGDARGRTLGFPTINQRYSEILVNPKFGVYKSQVLIDNKIYNAITNLGNRPTYPVDYIISETFIKDFSGDLYGKELRVTLKEFLREEEKFSSLEELKKQVMKDIGR